jgi:hypothetical protein
MIMFSKGLSATVMVDQQHNADALLVSLLFSWQNDKPVFFRRTVLELLIDIVRFVVVVCVWCVCVCMCVCVFPY